MGTIPMKINWECQIFDYLRDYSITNRKEEETVGLLRRAENTSMNKFRYFKQQPSPKIDQLQADRKARLWD